MSDPIATIQTAASSVAAQVNTAAPLISAGVSKALQGAADHINAHPTRYFLVGVIAANVVGVLLRV